MPHPQPTTEATKATRRQLAKSLQAYLRRNKLSVQEFTETVLRTDRKNTVAYGWLGARCMPSQRFVPILSHVLHKPASFFTTTKLGVKPAAETPVPAFVLGSGNGIEGAVYHPAPGEAAVEPDEAVPGPVQAPIPVVVPARIVRARAPRVIDRERAKANARTIAETLGGTANNSLTYWSNGDGSATVTLLYTASRKSAKRVLKALNKLGVEGGKKDAI